MISIFTTSRYPIHTKSLRERTKKLMHELRLDSYALNIVFIGKRKMRSIAQEYGHGDVAKPVLTFNYAQETPQDALPLLGEIYICFPQAVLLAAEKDLTLDGMLDYLIKHGLHNLTHYS